MNKKSDLTCFECEEGIYEIFESSYKKELDNGKTIEIPNFLRYRCPKCGDVVTPDTSLQRLEDKICWGMNYVTEEEFNEFLERRNLSVSQAAELLGVYPLDIENWKRGFKHVDDSVSRLIRIFNKFDGTFEWVKNEYGAEEKKEKASSGDEVSQGKNGGAEWSKIISTLHDRIKSGKGTDSDFAAWDACVSLFNLSAEKEEEK